MKARGSRLAGALLATTTMALVGCDDAGGPPPATGNTPPVAAPAPGTPSPPPLQPTNFVGAIYAGTNNNGPGGNWVVAFGRRTDGTLVPIDSYDTYGVGRASYSITPPRLNSLAAEDSLLAVDNRFLLVVNALTNDVTSFRINADYTLTRAGNQSSGGASPISLAYHNGIVYVANADEDGVFTSPADQRGNITALRLDLTTGLLSPGGSPIALRGRPSDLEVASDGSFLLASSLNADSPLLPQPSAASITSFRIGADGLLASAPAGTGMSTRIGNTAGRNLPNVIGIETYALNGRQFVIAAESRTVSSTGAAATGFASVQTGSVSTWEIAADGSLQPREQDFLLGPSVTQGPKQAGFLAYSSEYSTFWVATAAGATISGYGIDGNGRIQRGELQASGIAVDPAAPGPLAQADGFVDMAISHDRRWLYQLVGLKGRIDVYEIDTLVAFNLARRQQVTTGLLPMDNLQGLVAVGPPTP